MDPKSLSQEELHYLVHHVFLPPKLPDKDDAAPTHDYALVQTVSRSLTRFRDHVPEIQHRAVDAAAEMMQRMADVHEYFEGPSTKWLAISEGTLVSIVEDMCTKGGSVPLYVAAQNAGVILTKADDDMNIEVFELAPLNHDVITTKGRLRRCFPSSAVAVPVSDFQCGLHATLAASLAKLSVQPVAGTKPQARKAGQMHDEERDTTHPRIITNFVIAFLSAFGTPANTTPIWKNTREEVIYRNSLLPWRRSPAWLLVRVSLQLCFARLKSHEKKQPVDDVYKDFMIFFLAEILGGAKAQQLESDLLHAMNSKVYRRLNKHHQVGGGTRDFAYASIRQTNGILEQRWTSLQENDTRKVDLSALPLLDVKGDALIDIPNLNAFLRAIDERTRDASFVDFEPKNIVTRYSAGDLPRLLDRERDPGNFDILSFEAWVAANLDDWLGIHIADPDTCGLLASRALDYHARMLSGFSGNPESMSIMLLTVMELWVACDRAAIYACPLLKEYDPGIPAELLQTLLLPLKADMGRLRVIEDYLHDRLHCSRYLAPHVFTAFGTADCFAARWFNQSLNHQNLMLRIEQWAEGVRQAKREELSRKKDKYRSLMERHNNTAHEDVDVYNKFSQSHQRRHVPKRCSKCKLQAEAKSISIDVHEWPLPSNIAQARSTVFELDVPQQFGQWRDITLFLQLNVLGGSYNSKKKPGSQHRPQSYSGLAIFFASRAQRCGLLSETKPHEVTHRNSRAVTGAMPVDNVCLQNGLRYSYYDEHEGCFLAAVDFSNEVERRCTYAMPASSASLQQFLSRPAPRVFGPPPNTVIATQSECPSHMSLEEYKALCSIPLGNRIQWQNILLQLHAPSVDYKKLETLFTILQCAFQVGPRDETSVLRENHIMVEHSGFATKLLDGLRMQLQHVRINWQATHAISCIMTLACRLCSLTSSTPTRQSCMDLLAGCREVTLEWLDTLQGKASRATEEEIRTKLHAKVVLVALICCSSFSVDRNTQRSVLASPIHASTLLRCSIAIQEGQQSIGAKDRFVALLHRRWQTLLLMNYKHLSEQIIGSHPESLDDAIRLSWPAYNPTCAWSAVTAHDHWLYTKATNFGTSEALAIHFNLLTGELLVDGVPLGRLPSQYERHPVYQELFGRSVVDVMPSALPGMRFSAKSLYQGYTLHFGMSDGSSPTKPDLLLRAMNGSGCYELIPRQLLVGHIPLAFVKEHIHWYNTTESIMEFRPQISPWAKSSASWIATQFCPSGPWHIRNDDQLLISIKSRTAKLVAEVLEPLEDLPRIHCTVDEPSSLLEIDLPRLQLAFSVRTGTDMMESRQYRGMFVDKCQSIGTLIGLQSKLVLKNKNPVSRRIILIPTGRVSFQRSGEHVQVTISKHAEARATAYTIDDLLGRLVDRGNYESKLLRCYLHGLTSFCLPDPLTQQTGTEEALSILRSAAVSSFASLSETSITMLRNIARISPRRECYPADERVMQVVHWSPKLGFLAQHGGYYTNVCRLYMQHTKMGIFDAQKTADLPSLEERMDVDLLERDNIRSSTFRISGFGAECFSREHDVIYSGRGAWKESRNAERAFALSNFLLHKTSHPCCKMPRDLADQVWQYVAQSESLPQSRSLPWSLAYDASWLTESRQFISEHWLTIHGVLARRQSRLDNTDIVMWLATLAFAEEANLPVLYTIASFLTVGMLANISAPHASVFRLPRGTQADSGDILNSTRRARLPLEQCPEANLTCGVYERESDFVSRRQSSFDTNASVVTTRMVSFFTEQWPCETPSPPPAHMTDTWSTYINVDAGLRSITLMFKEWYENYRFRQYIDKVSSLVNCKTSPSKIPSPSITVEACNIERYAGFVTAERIFLHPAPALVHHPIPSASGLKPADVSAESRGLRLAELITRLETKAGCRYENQYLQNLKLSLTSLQSNRHGRRWRLCETLIANPDTLLAFKEVCQKCVDEIYAELRTSAGVNTQGGIQQWPRVRPLFFLEQLSHRRWDRVPDGWKECIIQFGRAITALQQAERMYKSRRNSEMLLSELQNPGHTNWDPFEQPESLLLEIESGILIREVQEQIAARMKASDTGSNEIMQLNMGEGKSSVIVPKVASALADGGCLVRIIAASPQAKQMFNMLVAKLGGLLDRPVFLMPFSRSVALSDGNLQVIKQMYVDCMARGGVILLQPEHILSFKLMAIERMISGEGDAMLQLQGFLNKFSRDIVDESDENFSVKFELVYTMGTQRPIDYSPSRWICIQEVLDAVRRFMPTVKTVFSESVELHPGPSGCFRRARLLRGDAVEDLVTKVAEYVCENGLTGLPIAQETGWIREAVCKYIRQPHLTREEIELVEGDGGFATPETRDTLLLLRGLLAGGILSFIFSNKRWRVDYGLDPTRRRPTRLAVPFRAKDVPSSRSEFSHPDVVIALTSLSYYYYGLSGDDLFLAFHHLQQSEQADMEYQTWVSDACSLPASFRQLVGVNLEDRSSCIRQLFPCLRYSKSVIDYFLSHTVFPKEMREFPHKLSASGWDLGETKGHPTTGFSGTNDSRIVLPLSVKQLDLDDQMHTNALVLDYLLQPENDAVVMQLTLEEPGTYAEKLLAMVVRMEPPVRVILDVGAQILELDNISVAEAWLKSLPDDASTQAVVFVDNDHHISVVDRKGHIELLQTSPFATQLDLCLVFLDEVHTRGIDLVLPDDYRAAVTLGANMTKDRLVQACMRMRRLGKGQSVVFCIPDDVRSGLPTPHPAVADVLEWAIIGTWQDAARSIPLWAVQGMRHSRQGKLWDEAHFEDGMTMSEETARKFLEGEALSISDRYQPSPTQMVVGAVVHGQATKDDPIALRFQDFRPLDPTSATLTEEQERELSPEVEEQREIQRALPARPAKHHLHPDISAYVSTGTMPENSTAHMPAFETLSTTSAASYLDLAKCACRLTVSIDFTRTVEADAGYASDCYHRSVQWILASSSGAEMNRMMIISPFEAQELLPQICQSRHVSLHLYAARPNPRYPALDALDLFTVPEQKALVVPQSLAMELNLFAGQLYFGSLEECINVSQFLGLTLFEDQFLGADVRMPHTERSYFVGSPVKFFKIFLSQVRRNSMDIGKTHLGYLLDCKRPADLS